MTGYNIAREELFKRGREILFTCALLIFRELPIKHNILAVRVFRVLYLVDNVLRHTTVAQRIKRAFAKAERTCWKHVWTDLFRFAQFRRGEED